MKAIRCDRCGRVEDVAGRWETIPTGWEYLRSTVVPEYVGRVSDKSNTEKIVDLCDICTKSFLCWLLAERATK